MANVFALELFVSSKWMFLSLLDVEENDSDMENRAENEDDKGELNSHWSRTFINLQDGSRFNRPKRQVNFLILIITSDKMLWVESANFQS